jgi:uncharacterized protein YecE (DUF72 family)
VGDGLLSPANLAARFLSYYDPQFDALEVDATFYLTPAGYRVKGWQAKTPPNFLFALKTPREITHDRGLREADSLMNEFLPIISYSYPSVTQLWRRHLFEGQMPRNSRRLQNLS